MFAFKEAFFNLNFTKTITKTDFHWLFYMRVHLEIVHIIFATEIMILSFTSANGFFSSRNDFANIIMNFYKKKSNDSKLSSPLKIWS